jgi:hypothetical protein
MTLASALGLGLAIMVLGEIRETILVYWQMHTHSNRPGPTP